MKGDNQCSYKQSTPHSTGLSMYLGSWLCLFNSVLKRPITITPPPPPPPIHKSTLHGASFGIWRERHLTELRTTPNRKIWFSSDVLFPKSLLREQLLVRVNKIRCIRGKKGMIKQQKLLILNMFSSSTSSLISTRITKQRLWERYWIKGQRVHHLLPRLTTPIYGLYDSVATYSH